MPLKLSYTKQDFHFAFEARTSRGDMHQKTSWFISVSDTEQPGHIGIGECGPLPGLSIDDRPDFETQLHLCIESINKTGISLDNLAAKIHVLVPPIFPAIRFGLETALMDFQHGGRRVIYHNDFTRGAPIPINGLIWMGDAASMLQQVKEKLSQGFTCLKLKVGGLDFDTELSLIADVRKLAGLGITIRLDANGSFPTSEAMTRLEALKKFNIHSIEQPLAPSNEAMRRLCSTSPIPIALDEELITHTTYENKKQLLLRLKPQFIVLKPMLLGGLQGCKEWIDIADKLEIGWWVTSALESNIGLNAICQFVANYRLTMPQGLGTGAIYKDNFPSPLRVHDGAIFYDNDKTWSPVVL
ncbi:MAG: o-succinylbenzoate synthase [Chryseolinea sp.]